MFATTEEIDSIMERNNEKLLLFRFPCWKKFARGIAFIRKAAFVKKVQKEEFFPDRNELEENVNYFFLPPCFLDYN